MFFFTINSPRVTQRLVSNENALKSAQNPLAFKKNCGHKLFFYSNLKQLKNFFKVTFEFKFTVWPMGNVHHVVNLKVNSVIVSHEQV